MGTEELSFSLFIQTGGFGNGIALLATCYMLVSRSLRVFFDPEDGSNMFIRNDGRLPTDYTGLYPKIQNSS
jgi:hypothetical protein